MRLSAVFLGLSVSTFAADPMIMIASRSAFGRFTTSPNRSVFASGLVRPSFLLLVFLLHPVQFFVSRDRVFGAGHGGDKVFLLNICLDGLSWNSAALTMLARWSLPVLEA